jgi:hypothetical protein
MNKRGCRGTADGMDGPFTHVMWDAAEQVGMGRDLRGDGSATCKIAGIAYTGSNPVPATSLHAPAGDPVAHLVYDVSR